MFVNSAFCQLCGWSEEELVGQTAPYVYWPPEDAADILDRFRKAHERLGTTSAEEAVLRLRHKNDERFLVRIKVAPLTEADGRIVGSVAAFEDLRQIGSIKAILQDRDQFIESVTRALPEIIYVFDLRDRNIVYANRSFAEVLGYSSEEVHDLGSGYMSLLHPDDLARLGELFTRWDTSKDQQVLEAEYRIRSADGEYHWFLSRDTAFQRDESGKVTQIIGAAQDITERKKAEEARVEAERHLRESENRYRLLADNATDMIARNSPSGLFRDVSPACDRLLGFTPIELFGRSVYELVHPDDRDRVFGFHHKLVESKNPLTLAYRMRRKDGDFVWTETNAQPILDLNSGDVVEILAVSRDVTDRHAAEEALRQSEELFRALVEKSSDGIAMIEANGKIRYFSGAATRILGYKQADLNTVNAREIVFDEDYAAFALRAKEPLAEAGGSFSTTLRVRPKAGNVRHVEVVVTNHVADPWIQSYVVNFRDISDRVILEDQLRQAQKMEAVGELAGGIAHDFNNILTAIIGNVAMVLETVGDTGPERPTLLAVDKAARRAADLTNRLLGYSRRTALHLRPINLNRIVQETLALLRPSIDPRIVFSVRLIAEIWPVQADADQINQVLTNLCLNGRDAMPRGGGLTVRTENVVIDADYIKSYVFARAGDYVLLAVEDTGRGMTPEVSARVFEPFFTTKPMGSGTGLGLAMVYGIVKAHGGWVTCESEPGQGTRMEFYLPRSNQPVNEPVPEKTVKPANAIRTNELVLLVDDEPAIRMLGKHVLEQNGYRVLLAEDGVDAIETFREVADRVALVILDLTMPRMSGQDAFRHLRQIAPSIRVLFSSGYSADQLQELDDGVAFINKPYRPADLLEAVRSHIRPE